MTCIHDDLTVHLAAMHPSHAQDTVEPHDVEEAVRLMMAATMTAATNPETGTERPATLPTTLLLQ